MTATLTVIAADPLTPGPRALLQASHDMMRALFPPEENYVLDFEELRAPDIRFFAATDGHETLGTGALALRDGYARGRGVAQAILTRLEAEARSLGLPLLRLETADILDGAVRLYARQGFRPCGRFGEYQPNPSSLYMEKALT